PQPLPRTESKLPAMSSRRRSCMRDSGLLASLLTTNIRTDTDDMKRLPVSLWALCCCFQAPRFFGTDSFRLANAERYKPMRYILSLSIRVVRRTVVQLVDTMPEPGKMGQIREVALSVPGTLGIEKCFARRTGLKYHVDLHLEVDPGMTVRESHDIATQVRTSIR